MSVHGRIVLLVLSLAWAGSLAQAAVELLGVRTTVDRQATTVLLRLPARVEYSPTRIASRLFVVDLTGISGTHSPESQPVESPLVRSYRLLTYRGADNQPHLALELTLKEEAQVNIAELPEGLQVRVQKDPGKPSASAAPTRAVAAAAGKSESEPRPQGNGGSRPIFAASPRRTSVREISVAQPEDGSGLDVEIVGDATMQYRTMELRQPDRLVVDIPNAVNQIRQRRLEVNAPPLKSVRVAQLTRQPAITRVVMDLDSRVRFEVRPQSNGLLVSLGESTAAETKPAASAKPPATGASATPAPLPQAELRAAPVLPVLSVVEGSEVEGTVSERSSNPTRDEAASIVQKPAPAPATPEREEPVLLASNQPTAAVPPRRTPPAALAASPVPEVFDPPAPLPAAAAVVPPSAPAPAAQAPIPAASRLPEPVLVAQQTVVPPSLTSTMSAQRQTYTGEPISVNLKDVDLKDFFRLIHEISGLNVVLDPNVSGVVTLVLDEVPWDQAMDIVMKNSQLGREVLGNVVRIARMATLEAEEKQRRDLALAIEQGQPRETVTRVLSYAQAPALVATLKRFLSPRGDLVADPRTNMLIITDIAAAIAQIDRLIGTLDQKAQQVEIEARIVAASRSFARDIGSQLAASGNSGRMVLGGTGLVGESPIKRGTTPPLFIGAPPEPPLPGEPPKFANVAQPMLANFAAVAPTAGTSFLLSTPTFALDAILTAAESRGLGKLLSRPKIITQNNVEASVKQGVRIPVQTSINNTITIQFIDVVLRLTVTPQITSEGTIFLSTDVENTTLDPGIPRIQGIPALDTQQATTKVLVGNGGTVFFGGVIQTTNTLTEQQVPLLGSIPLIGNLFRRKATSSDTRELLFFITPRIVQS